MTKSKLLTSLSKVFQFLICGGLVASGSAFAQSSAGSTVSIEQIGADNIAILAAPGAGNSSTIIQSGSGNTATLSVQGTGNGSDDGRVEQYGKNNDLTADIDGNDNQYRVRQNSDGAANTAVFSQSGSNNGVDIVQRAADLTTGLANSAVVFQTGNGNASSVNQTALYADATQYSNRTSINQNGDDNLATTTQMGNNNASVQEQNGDGNVSDILQTGDNNLAIHRQTGDNLSLPSDTFSGMNITQTGNASVIVEQYAPGLGPLPPG